MECDPDFDDSLYGESVRKCASQSGKGMRKKPGASCNVRSPTITDGYIIVYHVNSTLESVFCILIKVERIAESALVALSWRGQSTRSDCDD